MNGASLIFLIAVGLLSGLADLNASRAADNYQLESRDRTVDQVALDAKRRGVETLRKIVEKSREKREEPELLLRLAESYQELASIEFRVQYASGGKGEKSQAFMDAMRKSVQPLSRLVDRYGNNPLSRRALYLRAKAYRETGQKDLAVIDLKTLMKSPASNEGAMANIAFWDLLMEKKDYAGVIEAIRIARLDSKHRYYGVALERLSWAYYYLNDVPHALKKAEEELRFYAAMRASAKEAAIEHEKAASNLTLFYVTALEKKVPGYSVNKTLDYLGGLLDSDELGKGVVQMVYLLRSRGMDAEIDSLFRVVAGGNIGELYKSDFYLAVYENQLNRRSYEMLREVAERELRLVYTSRALRYDTKRFNRAKKMFFDAATAFQRSLLQSKNQPDEVQIAQTLKPLYEFMIRVSKNDVSTQAKIRFNLAETLAVMKDFEGATSNYRWVVRSVSASNPELAKLSLDSATRAIIVRYESFKEKQVVPKELVATSVSTAPKVAMSEAVVEWMSWLDEYPQDQKIKHGVDFFDFELNRILYHQGQILEAMKRLEVMVERLSSSPYALAAASLIIDTTIVSEQWERTSQLAKAYLAKPNWAGSKDAEFRSKLEKVASDSDFKLVEIDYKAGSYAKALAGAQAYLQRYPKGSHRHDCYELAANASLAAKDKKGALRYFAELQKEGAKKPQAESVASLTAASLSEETGDLDGANRSFQRYLTTLTGQKVNADDLAAIRRKVLFYAWLSSSADLEAALRNPAVCGRQADSSCIEFRNRLEYAQFKGPLNPRSKVQVMSRARERSADRILWATLALKFGDALSFRERQEMLQTAASTWADTDPLLKISLYPELSRSIASALRFARAYVRQNAPAKLDKVAISRRVQLIQDLETGTSKVLEFPWVKVKIHALNELSGVYDDLTQELKTVQPPKGLDAEGMNIYRQTLQEMLAPFQKKRDEIRQQAIALYADSGDESTFNAEGARISVSLLDAVKFESEADKVFRQSYVGAMKNANFPKVSFLVQEAKRKEQFSPAILSMLQAISFASVGAGAEAIQLLEQSYGAADSDLKVRLALPLAAGYFQSQSKTKAEKYVADLWSQKDEIKAPWFGKQEQAFLNEAARWSGVTEGGKS